jgi:hypothetical protein
MLTGILRNAGAISRGQDIFDRSPHHGVESFNEDSRAAPTRVRITISHELLESCGIHHDWAKFWFLVPKDVSTVAELLVELWRLLHIDSHPQAKVSCQGFYIPTSSSVEILREGDILSVRQWSQDSIPNQTSGAL